jgi:twinkle protein
MTKPSVMQTPRDPELPLVDAEALIQQGHTLYRTGGLPRGDSTGFRALDAHYTVAPAQVTVVTGCPASGKSELVDAFTVNLLASGWEFAVYSPENYPVATHLVKLVEKVVGKPFGPGPTTRMTEAEYRAAAIALCERVYWLDPDFKTPDELIETGLSFRTDGRKLGIVLDPWNTLDHDRKGLMETDYVSSVLTRVIRLARAANAHIWLIVHPAKLVRDRDGNRPVPSPTISPGRRTGTTKPTTYCAYTATSATRCRTQWTSMSRRFGSSTLVALGS